MENQDLKKSYSLLYYLTNNHLRTFYSNKLRYLMNTNLAVHIFYFLKNNFGIFKLPVRPSWPYITN